MFRFRVFRSIRFLAPLVVCLLILAGCSASGSELVGKWERITDDGRPRGEFVTITKEGSSYYWEDEDGKFKATLEDGQLHIDVGLGSAVAYYDQADGIMRASYLGMQYKFQRVK